MNPATPGNEGGTGVGSGGDQAELRSLDSFGFERVSLLKIDVERFESEVLDGAVDTIRRNRPAILIEIMGGEDYETASAEILERIHVTWRKLETLGYTVTPVFRAGRARPSDQAPGLEALEAKKQNLHQLAIDGVTLMTGTGDQTRYTIKDLSQQNAGADHPNPLWTPDPACVAALQGSPTDAVDTLCRLQNVWTTGNHVRDAFVRPNEFYMAPAKPDGPVLSGAAGRPDQP